VKALSIRQPWAHAVLHLGKDVENRIWATRYRGLLVVHAPKTVDTLAGAYLEWCRYRLPDPLVTGALVGTVRVVGCVDDSDSEWAEQGQGQWHWQLTDPRPFLAPIPWRGALRLFDVPDEVVTW